MPRRCLDNLGLSKPLGSVHVRPNSAGLVALQHRLNQRAYLQSILKCAYGRPLFPGSNEVINIGDGVAEGIGPTFLVTGGQMYVRPNRWRELHCVLGQDLVGPIIVADPQFVLLFLAPARQTG